MPADTRTDNRMTRARDRASRLRRRHPRFTGLVWGLGSAAIWIVIVVVCWVGGSAASLVGVPAPHLLVSIVLGAVLALAGWVRKQVPRRVNIAAQAAVGVVMGGYLNLDSARQFG